MADHDHESEPGGRVTSPMQEFTARKAGIGFAVLAIGLLLAYFVPALAV